MNIIFGDYTISDDKNLLNINTIYQFLRQSYWASQRSRETIVKAVENSLCLGVYHQHQQIGFARFVTDGATIYWLCDVFVDEAYRGQGIGKKLMEAMESWDSLKGLNGILRTRDAHGLYEQYGFVRHEMMRKPAAL
jgi:GNAT superfamily N-acetyltransferase